MERNKTAVDNNLVMSYCYQLIQALHYLHEQHIAHRDLKPENILLQKNGRLRVCDLVSTFLVCHDDSPRDVIHYTTYRYAPPEHFIVDVKCNPFATDMWGWDVLSIIWSRVLH